MAGAKARRGGGAKPRGRRRGAGGGGGGGEEEVSEYERQRRERIRENKERLESLGLVKLSSSLQSHGGEQQEGSTSAHGEGTGGKKRRVGRDGDEEYQPSDESSDDDEEEEKRKGERKEKRCSSGSRRTPKKERRNKDLTNEGSARKRLFSGGDALELDGVDDDDHNEVAFQKAIALSLGEPVEDLDAIFSARSPNSYRNSPNNGNIGKGKATEIAGRGRKRKGNVRRFQITEDEAVACFFTFDEAGKGNIALRDLQKLAATQDFSWSDKEMIDMIDCFDTDSDRRLNFDDFHNILSRCNILQDQWRSQDFP